MSSELALKSEPAAILACTVSRNIHHFDLLIGDMEAEFGEAWGDLSFDEAHAFLGQPDATDLQFLVVTLTAADETDPALVGGLIDAAKGHDIDIILVADAVPEPVLDDMIARGARGQVAYPLTEGALRDALEPLRQSAQPAPALVAVAETPAPASPAPGVGSAMPGQAALFAVHGLAGGTGASTLATNLAWELATIDKKRPPRVCLIDLDLQNASVATYLDLPCREATVEILQEAQTMDVDGFRQALVGFQDQMTVFTAPPEIVPLDIVGPDEIDAVLKLAGQSCDIVVVDMPHTVSMWTETVLKRADVYFTTMELDMRSAQNAMRFLKALKAEGLPVEKLNFVLNRAPRMTDLSGKGRAKKLAESLGVTISTTLPDGGKPVTQAGDHGQPLADVARKNPLRREIRKLADGLHKAMLSAASASR